MPFQIIYSYDINFVSCDAVVADIGEIYRSYEAGKNLDSFGYDFSTTVLNGFELIPANRKNCRYIIHAPAYTRPFIEESEASVRFYYECALQLVSDFGLNSVAFPLIGRNMESVSNESALQIASEEIYGYLQLHAGTNILLVIQREEEFRPDPLLLEKLSYYVNRQKIIRLKEQKMLENVSTGMFPAITAEDIHQLQKTQSAQGNDPRTQSSSQPKTERGLLFHRPAKRSRILQEAEERTFDVSVFPVESFRLDESFSQMVLRKIDEKGFKKDSDCYSRANIDRRVFSRLRSDRNYHPKKTTAIALAIALEMSQDETEELLMKAGYSLSPSILFDVIIEFCISHHIYNIFTINELLYQYEQPQLFECE